MILGHHKLPLGGVLKIIGIVTGCASHPQLAGYLSHHLTVFDGVRFNLLRALGKGLGCYQKDGQDHAKER